MISKAIDDDVHLKENIIHSPQHQFLTGKLAEGKGINQIDQFSPSQRTCNLYEIMPTQNSL